MCLNPWWKKDIQKMIPCGKCPKCKLRHAAGWSFRLMQEEKVSDSAWFITLTYNNEALPLSITQGRAKMVLHKNHLQRFFKRLRKAQTRLHKCHSSPGKPFTYKSIKYYAVGEYGGRTRRPHYHIILFNANVELIQDAWTYLSRSKKREHAGEVHYGDVNELSVGYTLKYIMNPEKNKGFSLMSKGLGKSYLTKSMIAWHQADLRNRMYCSVPGNIKCSMPRYYKDRVYTDLEREVIAVHFQEVMQDKYQKMVTAPRFDYQKMLWNKDQAIRSAYKKNAYQSLQKCKI